MVLFASTTGAQILVLQGRPIAEPVAVEGPFVMKTTKELEQAYADFRRDGFVGWPWETPDPNHEPTNPRFTIYPDRTREQPASSGS